MNTYTINGTYGASQNPCLVFVLENGDGSKWYVCEGSTNVNFTYDELSDGVDVETVSDYDCFTAGAAIMDEHELIAAVEA